MVTAFKQKHSHVLMIDADIISMNLRWDEKFSQDKIISVLLCIVICNREFEMQISCLEWRIDWRSFMRDAVLSLCFFF